MFIVNNFIKNVAPYLLGLLLGLYFFTFNLTGMDLSYFPGDLGDARFVVYILEHAHQFFLLNNVPATTYWSAPFMFPESDVISYSVNLLGTFPIYSSFRLLGINSYISFIYWFISLCILNYSCAYFFIKWLLNNKYAAVIGAYIFAFSIALSSQSFHAQTFPRFAIPLALWAGCLFIKSFSIRYFISALLLLVYQFYCGMYLGFMLFIPLFILMVSGLLIRHKDFINTILKPRQFLYYFGSIVFSIALLLPLVIPYVKRSQLLGLKSYAEIFESLPTIYSFLNASSVAANWGFMSSFFNDRFTYWWDHELFIGGISLLSIIVVGIYLLRNLKAISQKIIVSSLIISAVGTFFLFFRIGTFSLYKYVMIIPGYGSMRALQRIINVELIFIAIAVACFFILLSRVKEHKSIKLLVFLLFFVLIILDNQSEGSKFVRTKVSVALERETELKKKVMHLKPGDIFAYEPIPLEDNSIYYQLDAMLVAQQLSLKTINGYSATCPGSFGPFWRNPNPESRKTWLEPFDIGKVHVIN